jgi:hypothetical protein
MNGLLPGRFQAAAIGTGSAVPLIQRPISAGRNTVCPEAAMRAAMLYSVTESGWLTLSHHGWLPWPLTACELRIQER